MPKRQGRYKGLPQILRAGTMDSGTEYLEITFEVYAILDRDEFVAVEQEFNRYVKLFLTDAALDYTVETLEHLGMDYEDAMDRLIDNHQQTGDMVVDAPDLTWAEWVYGDGVELQCKHKPTQDRAEPYENWNIVRDYEREPDSVSESTLKRVAQRMERVERKADRKQTVNGPEDISDDEIPF